MPTNPVPSRKPTTRRRICFVAPFGLGAKTTVWARTLPLARQLAARGWEVMVVIPPWDTPGDAGKRWDDAGVQVVNVATGGGPLATTSRLLRESDRFAPDIVHIIKPRAHAGLVQWWLWQRRRLFPTPLRLVLDMDDWEQAWAPINRYPWPVARFLAWQEEWGLRHADAITAASRWLCQRVQQASPAMPLLYLPNGIEPPAATLDEPATGGQDVLFFSRFVEITPAWLAAFLLALYEKSPGSRLLVAGEPVQPGLERLFHEHLATLPQPVADQVQWLGFVRPETLHALYSRIGCAIFPAEPVPLQEAKCSVRLATTLLAGVPVIASAVGEQAAYGAAGAARLVPAAASPAAFAAEVAAVLADPREQVAMSRQARTHLLSTYDWALLGKQLDDFYANILAG
ncbi:MAG: glycosyltransferase family 4 protein [Caldilineaceae bacterium]|nr:glycosyltransferase family 4 protein [Caldilineaceae bacterium]